MQSLGYSYLGTINAVNAAKAAGKKVVQEGKDFYIAPAKPNAFGSIDLSDPTQMGYFSLYNAYTGKSPTLADLNHMATIGLGNAERELINSDLNQYGPGVGAISKQPQSGGGSAYVFSGRTNLGGTNGDTTSNPADTGSVIGGEDIPAPLQKILDVVQQQLDALVLQGKTPQPDIPITPEKAAEFLAQATREMDPFYQRLGDEAAADLKSSFSRRVALQQQGEQDLTRQYQEGYDQTAANAAETGQTFGGVRGRQERKLAEDANREDTRSREQLAFDVGQQVTAGARNLGSTAFGTKVGTTTIAGMPQFNAGQRDVQFGAADNLYTLPTNVEGELERQKRAAVEARKAELEAAYRGDRSLVYA
jgi:hypothetical protein